MPPDASTMLLGESDDRKVAGLRRHAGKLNAASLASIRSAAARVFVEHGYSSVTMDDLARAAGVTRQTLYRHFPSKFDLACDYMARAWPGMTELWRSLGDHDLTSRPSVAAWMRKLICEHVHRPDIRAFVEMGSSEPRFRSLLADQIAQTIAALGEVHPFFAAARSDPSGLEWAKAHLFIATIRERCAFEATGQDWIRRDHLEAIMTDWLMSLLAGGSS